MPRPLHPAETLLARESGTSLRHAGRTAVLCYPNTYRVASSSLGFQVVWAALDGQPGLACHRAVVDPQFAGGPGRTGTALESGARLCDHDAVLVSIAYELDLANLVDLLRLGGLAPLARDRTAADPPVIAGGPLTQSNVLPLGPFADVVVMGEADHVIHTVAAWVADGLDRAAVVKAARDTPGCWIPSEHGDAVPDLLSVGADCLPARGAWFSPDAEFRDMALLEASRGCPRYCKFCVVRAPVAPMREPELDRVVAVLDTELFVAAPRVGFVGAAVSDWGPIKGALRAAIERGKGVGISSLRADRLDEEFVGLLHKGGYRTLTVASDAPSQRMRGKMMKGLRERHLLEAARLARAVGMRQLKVYVILGLPDENAADIDELIAFGHRCADEMNTVMALSPFVPKLHTPLAEAPFAPIAETMAKIQRVQRGLKGRVEVRFDSPRQAWIEYRLSQGGLEAADAVLAAVGGGQSLGAWQKAFAALDGTVPDGERAAPRAAQRHGLWTLTGAR
ncbi:MAG: radical SAM protein [Myxococcales bacterium]|nr:radical SAM protein [Myxococcales bacterium]